jgi:hypothetical protein
MRFISMTSFAIAESVNDRLSLKINVRMLQLCIGQLKGTLKLAAFAVKPIRAGTLTNEVEYQPIIIEVAQPTSVQPSKQLRRKMDSVFRLLRARAMIEGRK